MKRPRLSLLTAVSLLSLCLCTASIYFWRRSFSNPTSAVPTTSDMRRILCQWVPPLNPDNPSLEATIERVSPFTRPVRYEIDWPALEAIKANESITVGSTLGLNRSLGELLAKLTASMGPKVRFTTHDDVIRISTINTPPSTHGIQYIDPPKITDYLLGFAPGTLPVWTPPTAMKPLYERTIGERRLTFGAYHGYLGLCLSPKDPADIYYKPKLPAPRLIPALNTSRTAPLYQHHPWFDIRLLVLPFWWLVAATAFFPLLWIVLFLRQLRRNQQHLCTNCGYDLRATPTQCPECGHIPQHP
jgi:hypothetical protein